MTDNVLELPQEKRPELLIGPFEVWKVQVDGRIIPRLTGFHDGDKIALCVDSRFSASFSKEDAYQAAWLISQALAIGEGYSNLLADNKDMPFAPIGCGIGSLDEAPKP